MRSEVAPANGTAARFEGKIYASWLNLIVTIRRWAGAVHGDIDSNRGRRMAILAGRLNALQLVESPITNSGSSPRDVRITKRTHFLLLIVKNAEGTTNRLSDYSKATLTPTD